VDIPWRANLVVSFHRSISLGSYSGLQSQVVENFGQKFTYFERPFTGKFSKFPKEFIATPNHVLCANFVKFGWPEIGKVVRYLSDENSQNSPHILAVASARIAPKIFRDRRQTMCSECPKFHPIPFTYGGVIAERVNTVETHYKVFPIFGQSLASSQLCYANQLNNFVRNILGVRPNSITLSRLQTWHAAWSQTCSELEFGLSRTI